MKTIYFGMIAAIFAVTTYTRHRSQSAWLAQEKESASSGCVIFQKVDEGST